MRPGATHHGCCNCEGSRAGKESVTTSKVETAPDCKGGGDDTRKSRQQDECGRHSNGA
jgi:hypothetical protein